MYDRATLMSSMIHAVKSYSSPAANISRDKPQLHLRFVNIMFVFVMYSLLQYIISSRVPSAQEDYGGT